EPERGRHAFVVRRSRGDGLLSPRRIRPVSPRVVHGGVLHQEIERCESYRLCIRAYAALKRSTVRSIRKCLRIFACACTAPKSISPQCVKMFFNEAASAAGWRG